MRVSHLVLVLGSATLVACGNSSSTASTSTAVAATSAASARPSAATSTAVAAAKPGADFKPHKLPKRGASGEHGAMVEQGPSQAGKAVLAEFAGEYTSTYGGSATVTQDGTNVTIAYDKGEATCVAGGDVLDCAWKQPDKSGRAVFIKTSTGMLDGTYGADDSNSNKGGWAFIPSSSLEEKPEDVAFAGTYESSFGGKATIEGEGESVTLTYKNGKADCVARADVLNCAWTQPTKSGHAIFLRNENGSLYGSWGKGESYASGGPWALTVAEEAPAPAPPAPPPPPTETSTGYANDGLPTDIPATGSKPPSVAEWGSVTREVTVWGSSALGCETKMLREWLRVSCRATGASTPVDVQTSVAGGQQAYMGMFGTTASLVVQVVRNRHHEAAFAWQDNGTADFYGATLVVDWTGGAPRPTLKFE